MLEYSFINSMYNIKLITLYNKPIKGEILIKNNKT